MTLSNGMQNIATEKEVNRWGGDGSRFRCYLCGYKFKVGDLWRWICSREIITDPNTEKIFGLSNFLVCKDCDGEDVMERWKVQNLTLLTKYWWIL